MTTVVKGTMNYTNICWKWHSIVSKIKAKQTNKQTPWLSFLLDLEGFEALWKAIHIFPTIPLSFCHYTNNTCIDLLNTWGSIADNNPMSLNGHSIHRQLFNKLDWWLPLLSPNTSLFLSVLQYSYVTIVVLAVSHGASMGHSNAKRLIQDEHEGHHIQIPGYTPSFREDGQVSRIIGNRCTLGVKLRVI